MKAIYRQFLEVIAFTILATAMIVGPIFWWLGVQYGLQAHITR